nr:hypothetical protein [Streptomyces sp. NBC_01456]
MCPGCGTVSMRVHSRYERKVSDTAVAGRQAQICCSRRSPVSRSWRWTRVMRPFTSISAARAPGRPVLTAAAASDEDRQSGLGGRTVRTVTGTPPLGHIVATPVGWTAFAKDSSVRRASSAISARSSSSAKANPMHRRYPPPKGDEAVRHWFAVAGSRGVPPLRAEHLGVGLQIR